MNGRRFELMNKNNKLASITVNNNDIHIDRVHDNRISNMIMDVDKWLYSRTDIVNRDNVLRLAKINGISTREEFLYITKAISITDTIWFKCEGDNLRWEDISPYSNRIGKLIADFALNGVNCNINTSKLRSPSPQYRIDGSIDKCVKRINNDIYIYKTDGERRNDLVGARPYSEYFAAKIAQIIGIHNIVEYNITEHITNEGFVKPYAYCKIFTSERESLVHMCDSVLRYVETDRLYEVIKNKIIIDRLKEMILLDSLILNIDRHSGNYGFLVDSDKYTISRLAPIFDNDCSLGSTVSVQYTDFDEAFDFIKQSRQPKTDLGTYDEHALWAMTKPMYKNLKDTGYIKLQNKFRGISERRMKFIEYIVNRRREEILRLFS